MTSFRYLLTLLLAALLSGCSLFAKPAQVGEDKLVIVNALKERVTISFSEDKKAWTDITFDPEKASEVVYRKYVKIVTVRLDEKLVYEDDVSPSGKYAIIVERSGRRVLRRPN